MKIVKEEFKNVKKLDDRAKLDPAFDAAIIHEEEVDKKMEKTAKKNKLKVQGNALYNAEEPKKETKKVSTPALKKMKLAESLFEDMEEVNFKEYIVNDLNNLIIDEWDTIKAYKDTLANIQEKHNGEDKEDLIAILNDIVKEEMYHVGQLEKAMQLLDPSFVSIESGREEADREIRESLGKRTLKESYAAIDVYDDLLDRAKSWVDDGYDADEATERAIDDGLIYDEDIFSLADNYIRGSAILDMFYDDLYTDLYKEVEEYAEEELDESLKKTKKALKEDLEDYHDYILDILDSLSILVHKNGKWYYVRSSGDGRDYDDVPVRHITEDEQQEIINEVIDTICLEKDVEDLEELDIEEDEVKNIIDDIFYNTTLEEGVMSDNNNVSLKDIKAVFKKGEEENFTGKDWEDALYNIYFSDSVWDELDRKLKEKVNVEEVKELIRKDFEEQSFFEKTKTLNNLAKVVGTEIIVDESLNEDKEEVTIGMYGDDINPKLFHSVNDIVNYWKKKGCKVSNVSGDFDYGWEMDITGSPEIIYHSAQLDFPTYSGFNSMEEFINNYKINNLKEDYTKKQKEEAKAYFNVEDIDEVSKEDLNKFISEEPQELKFIDNRENAILGKGEDYGFDEYDIEEKTTINDEDIDDEIDDELITLSTANGGELVLTETEPVEEELNEDGNELLKKVTDDAVAKWTDKARKKIDSANPKKDNILDKAKQFIDDKKNFIADKTKDARDYYKNLSDEEKTELKNQVKDIFHIKHDKEKVSSKEYAEKIKKLKKDKPEIAKEYEL